MVVGYNKHGTQGKEKQTFDLHKIYCVTIKSTIFDVFEIRLFKYLMMMMMMVMMMMFIGEEAVSAFKYLNHEKI